ncbi:glycosyltransferase family 2 protein [Hyalangium sp.]|uniref:glycosyltransferase family 2 protein n=1 Tax=Hyalangium sp. TaxID=2028555 RepID=UPI002D78EDE7|nr:glycosyltransferase [Hyalangium sp.]
MPSYNHAPFVERAVGSVLEQSLGDLELIIVDDGSTDDSRRILKSLEDPRISLIFQDNEGPSSALNTGLARARGQYIAFMSSDDVSLPHRLQTQLEFMRAEQLDLVFTLPQLIDERGRRLDDGDFPAFFGKTFSSSAELFRLLFYQGNFLCAPSAFLRADVLRAAGRFRPGSIQLQDFDMWVRMCPRSQIRLMGERLVQYRTRAEGNLSGGKHTVRMRFELAVLYQSLLDNIPGAFLRAAFPDVVGPDVAASAEDLELDKSFIYLSHEDPLIRAMGAQRLFSQLEDDRLAARLRDERGFDLGQFFRMTDTLDFQNHGRLLALKTECSRLRQLSRFRG